jgi:hypothetical protein
VRNKKIKMQINRQNYENYFLLYADGELTTSDRNAVQQFVIENKDLAIELEMIQASILPKEDVKLIDKNFLYKGVDYKTQQQLLLKLDNELPAQELAALDALLESNVNAKAEYDLLSKTTLDKNENIIFEHKHLLYKKEKDNVVVFGYLRWAAAAIFIGFALFTGIKFYANKNVDKPEIATATKENKIENIAPGKTENNSTQNTIKQNKIAQTDEAATTPKQNISNEELINTTENNIARETQKNVNNKNSVTNNNNERITNKQQENNTNNNQNNFIAKEEIPQLNNTIKNETLIAKNNTTENTINAETLYELENTYSSQNIVQNVVQKVEDNTENKILYMNESKVKKSKVGMFFSKIKNAVQKSAKVKPGNSIQIAGFEISGN